MTRSAKPARAWIPATVTTLLAVVLLFGCGLLREVLTDRGVAALNDPDSSIRAYVYDRMAPVGSPGIVGDASFGDSIARLGGGLVPVVVLVFLFTWLSARAARAGSSFTVLLGAWLGCTLGVGLGALASYQVFLWQNDSDGFVLGPQIRLDELDIGLYWGAAVGLLIGLVALLTWLMVRPRAAEPQPDEGAPEPPQQDPASYPPPARHAAPTSDETVRAPEPPPPAL